MEHKNIIIWQKWVDPFGYDDVEPENFDPYTADYKEEQEEDSSEQIHNDMMGALKHKPQSVKVIATPMGIIPMNENTSSSKIFNFWIGHTNFDISKKIADTIEKTHGVETLDIFTRYRFRISVGKAFDDSTTMRNINKKVYKELSDG